MVDFAVLSVAVAVAVVSLLAGHPVLAQQDQTSVFINVGGKDFTDDKGNLWLSDSVLGTFDTGKTYNTKKTIKGTDNGKLYQSERWSSDPKMVAKIPLQDGLYTIRLHFAEVFSKTQGKGKRVFDIAMEDNLVFEDFDIYVEANNTGSTAVVKETRVTVADGGLTIEFRKKMKQNPKICAIEVHPFEAPDFPTAQPSSAPSEPTLEPSMAPSVYPTTFGTFRPIFINAGGPTVKDMAGNIWVSDTGFYNVGSKGKTDKPIGGTDEDAIYQTERWESMLTDAMKYEIPVIEGDYDVYLHFAEAYPRAQAPGKRVFNVWIEGKPAFSNLDVYAEANAGYTQVIKNASTVVNDGSLTIEFGRVRQNPMISAIEIHSRMAPIYINAGGKNFTDDENKVWIADSLLKYHNTGRIYRSPAIIKGTTNGPLYQTERYDSMLDPELRFDIPVERGDYAVNLHLAETYFTKNGSGKRAFDVKMEGSIVFKDLDIYSEAGNAPNTALIKSTKVSVYDESLSIEFMRRTQNPKVCAISIIPLRSSVLSLQPLSTPTVAPSALPAAPSSIPSWIPSIAPVAAAPPAATIVPSASSAPSEVPSSTPSSIPSSTSSIVPVSAPTTSTAEPSASSAPSVIPSSMPSTQPPASSPTVAPSSAPSIMPSFQPSIAPVSAPSRPPSSLSPMSDFESIYINAGGQTFEDAVGNVWVSDAVTKYYNTGKSAGEYNQRPVNGTIIDALYQTIRWDPSSQPDMRYEIPLNNGFYDVYLHFAEINTKINGPGQRVFDVQVEGQFFDNVDVIAEANARDTALIKSASSIFVNDGFLTIEFDRVTHNPMICGIEVHKTPPTPPPTSSPMPTSSNAPSVSPKPSWSPTRSPKPSSAPSISPAPTNSAMPTAARTMVTDPTTSPVPSFTPSTSPAPTLSSMPSASPTTSISPTTSRMPTSAPSSTISPTRTASPSTSPIPTEQPSSAPTISFEPIRINCGGGGTYTDSNGAIWEADKYFISGSMYMSKLNVPIAGTSDPALYLSERYGSFKYEIPISNANFLVTLHFAEIFTGIKTPGKREFDVLVQGETFVERLDIYKEVGSFAALTKSGFATVTNGLLVIEVKRDRQNPKLSAIEIELAPPTVAPTPQPSTSASPSAPTNSPAPSEMPSMAPTMFPTETLLPWIDLNEDESYTPRHECSFVQAGTKFYMFGGRESPQKLDIYDYANNTWTTGASVPEQLNHFQAVVYEGLIWVIGAFRTNNFPNEEPEDNVYIYDPANDVWMEGPRIPWARGGGGLVVYMDKFYLVGGNTAGHAGGFVPWMDEYNPVTGTWRQLPDAPRSRDHFQAVVIGSKLYAVGGRLSSRGNPYGDTVKEVDVFEFVDGMWLTNDLPRDIPVPRSASAAAVFDGKIMIMGGEAADISDAFSRVDVLDPETGRWTLFEPMNYQRHGTQAIVSGKGVYIAGGSPNRGAGNQLNMEVYNMHAPEGTESVAGILDIVQSTVGSVTLVHAGGNQGVIINSIEVGGPNPSDFFITNKVTSGILVRHGTGLVITFEYRGDEDQAKAPLTVTHSGGKTLRVTIHGQKQTVVSAALSVATNKKNKPKKGSSKSKSKKGSKSYKK